MPPKEAFTKERLNGIGARAVEATLRTLSDQEAAAFAHLSCEYPIALSKHSVTNTSERID